jgi:hypothetical protein
LNRPYLKAVLEDCLTCDALIDSGSTISLILQTLLDELNRTVDPSKLWLKTECCSTTLGGFTQATSPLTKRLLLKLNFKCVSLSRPVYVTSTDTEQMLIGIDLIDLLVPLMDWKTSQVWSKITMPTHHILQRLHAIHCATTRVQHHLLTYPR